MTNYKKILILLAAGKGSRINNYSVPKQFILVNDKCLFLYPLSTFIKSNLIDEFIVVVNFNWVEDTKKIVNKYFPNKNIYIVEGGSTRNESIFNAYKFIKSKFNNINEKDIIITHDAARIFVDSQIINNNINAMNNYDFVTTAISLIDTISYAEDNVLIQSLSRNLLYNIQTPQTLRYFVLDKLMSQPKLYNTSDLTLLSFTNKLDFEIGICEGKSNNFKVTNDFDLDIAKYLLSINKNFF